MSTARIILAVSPLIARTFLFFIVLVGTSLTFLVGMGTKEGDWGGYVVSVSILPLCLCFYFYVSSFWKAIKPILENE